MTDLFAESARYFADLQLRITSALEALDGAGTFRRDAWSREPLDAARALMQSEATLAGGGTSCVLEGGRVFEKAAVNVSNVHGVFSEAHAAHMPGSGRMFRAAGISLVLHPLSPHVPTVHMNLRRIEHGAIGWFGGGTDLTPYYLVDDDARHFHRVLADVCARHPAVAHYAEMKAECDRYFHLPHRGEARGIGGIFFDDVRERPSETLAFVAACGDAFLEGYVPIVKARCAEPYGERERRWQLIRRGRYAEFNLLHDRGTVFGLRTGGRVESILASLPPAVAWHYDARPEPGSPEARLVAALVAPRNWLVD